MNPNKKDDASYLQTVGRALTILEMFRQQNTLSLPSIAKELGVGKNHRLSIGTYFDRRGILNTGSFYETVLFGRAGADIGILCGA